MLLSTSIPKGITPAESMRDCVGFNSQRDACGRGLFPLHIFHVCTSLSTCLWQSISRCSFKGRRNSFTCGLFALFFLPERGAACYTLSLLS